MRDYFDIIVMGGGNAALCAAIAAGEAGASVLLLERSGKDYRGGNSIHTRNMRVMHDQPTSILSGSYSEEEYFADLMAVTEGNTNINLAKLAIRQSGNLVSWLETRGMLFQPSISSTLSLSRTNAFFLAGGKTLVNSEYARAEKCGVVVRYKQLVKEVLISENKVVGVLVQDEHNHMNKLKAKSYIAASGGFESNKEWLKKVIGESADGYIVRGTKSNRGEVLASMLSSNVQEAGDATQFHCVAIDGRAPAYDGGIATRLDCVPFGIVLNKNGERFYDEGEDFWPKRYAIWGRKVAQQPQQTGYVLIDSKSSQLFMPSLFPPVVAESLDDLVHKMGLPSLALKTINDFNAATQPGNFYPDKLDGLATQGLECKKSNWARPLNAPPYYGYTLKPGITFTYLGVGVNEKAEVLSKNKKPIAGLYAAGELMAGNILGKGYLAGVGMTIGSVFGRIAGNEAAIYSKEN